MKRSLDISEEKPRKTRRTIPLRLSSPDTSTASAQALKILLQNPIQFVPATQFTIRNEQAMTMSHFSQKETQSHSIAQDEKNTTSSAPGQNETQLQRIRQEIVS